MTASCIHGIPWEFGCTPCGRNMKPITTGYSPGGNAPVYSRVVRYRIRGRITPVSRKGEFYDVDLTVEVEP